VALDHYHIFYCASEDTATKRSGQRPVIFKNPSLETLPFGQRIFAAIGYLRVPAFSIHWIKLRDGCRAEAGLRYQAVISKRFNRKGRKERPLRTQRKPGLFKEDSITKK
jgi:hypothetical protein